MLIATYNVGDGSDAALASDLDALRERGVRVVCLQETGDRKRLLRRWCRRNGWRVWCGRVPGSGSVAIVYAADVPVSSRFSRVAVPRVFVGAGAGPSWAKSKAVTGLNLRGGVTILNTHMVASATRRGEQYRWRRRHYRLHLAVLVAMIRRRRRRGRRVVSVGDMNGDPGHWLLGPLREVAKQHAEEPTHGPNLLDHVWSAGVGVRWAVPAKGYSSDHRPLVAAVAVEPS